MAFIFPYIGNVIIPTDFHMFQRGGSTTKQISLMVKSRGCADQSGLRPLLDQPVDLFHGFAYF